LQKTVSQDSAFKQNQISQLESGVKLIQQNLEMVKQSLENLTIKAPVDGQLTSLNAEIGDNKQKGQTIGQIDVQAGYKVTANIDEHYISRISKGLRATFSFDEVTYKLHIINVLPQVINGQFKIELAFEGDLPKGIKQGQSLQIRLTLSEKNKALVVKNGGFYAKTGGSWIFVVKKGEALKRSVKLGRQSPDYIEVTDGLQPGDVVISSAYETFGNAEDLVLKN